jgi:hypothetical protein
LSFPFRPIQWEMIRLIYDWFTVEEIDRIYSMEIVFSVVIIMGSVLSNEEFRSDIEIEEAIGSVIPIPTDMDSYSRDDKIQATNEKCQIQ